MLMVNTKSCKGRFVSLIFMINEVQILIRYLQSILLYKMHPIPKHKCFSSRLPTVFAQSIEATC